MKFLNGLSKDTCVTILPHDTADVDSVISAILLSKLLDFCNIQNEIAIFDETFDKWTTYFVKKLGYNLANFFVKNEDENRKLFLVDHYKTTHKGKVIACIDHHLTSENVEYDYYLYKPSCSTAYIIYKLFQKLNVPITKEIILLVGYASVVDTCSFKSTKTVLEEKDDIISLLNEYEFNVEEMLKEGLCLDDLTQMSTREIALNGIKTYEYGKNIIKSSYVQGDSLKVLDEVIQYISKLVNIEKLDMWIFIFADLINEKTVVYKITKEQVSVEKFNKIMSRAKDIMPSVEKEFLNN